MFFTNKNLYKNHIYQDPREFTMIYIVHDYEKRDTVSQFIYYAKVYHVISAKENILPCNYQLSKSRVHEIKFCGIAVI